MSVRAYLLAIRNRFRTSVGSGGLGYASESCEVTPGGRPPPRAGKLFVAVHAGPRRGLSDTHDGREYSAHVTVSLRINEPVDRVGPDLLEKATSGLDDVADSIIAVMENYQWAIMNAANALIDTAAGGSGVANGFVEPLRYTGDDGEARLVPGDWYEATAAADYSAAVLTIRFGRAKRLQLHGSVR